MKTVYLDVETLPQRRRREHFMAIAIEAAQTKPIPSNYKLMESKVAWRQQQIDNAADDGHEAWLRSALEAGDGELCVIAWWAPIVVRDVTSEITTAVKRNDYSEPAMLKTFWSSMAAYSGGQAVRFIGFNVQFDLRYLWVRSILNDIKPTVYVPWREPPYRERYIDLRYWWWGAVPPSGKGNTNLETMCRHFGIEVDDEITGADVADRWFAGDYDIVENHCLADVERVRLIAERLGL